MASGAKHKQKKRGGRKLFFATKPRLIVYRSNKHIYAQLVNDHMKQIITSFSSMGKIFPKNIKANTTAGAYFVGINLGQWCVNNNIFSIAFDKNCNRYAGRLTALADGARASGLFF